MSKAFFTAVIKAETSSVDLIETLEDYKKGSVEARDMILQAHYRIIYKIAQRRARDSKYSDDIFGDALQLLVQAVVNALQLEHDNLTGYIISWVHNGLKRSKIQHEAIVQMPPSTYSDQKFGNGVRPHRPESFSQFKGLAKRENPSLEFLELLDGISKTDRERQIIGLRKESYSYDEIAEILDMSPSNVGRIMLILTERFDQVYS